MEQIQRQFFIHLVGKWHKKLQVIDDEWNDTHFRSLEIAVVTFLGIDFPMQEIYPMFKLLRRATQLFFLTALVTFIIYVHFTSGGKQWGGALQ